MIGLLTGYYVLSAILAVLVWPYTYGTKGMGRVAWIMLGAVIVLSPLLLGTRVGFYYGLLANFTAFSWTSDTYMGKADRRSRSLVGGFLLALVAVFSGWPTETWLRVFLVPTVGHVVVSGITWPLLLRIPILRIPFLNKS